MSGGGGSADIKNTADQKALAEIAAERYDNYKNTFVPAENYYIDQSLNYANENREQQLAGQANTSIQSEFTDAINSEVQKMTASNVNPNSGTFNNALNMGHELSGAAAVDNINRTKTAIQDDALQAKQNVVSMGNAQSTEALSGLNQTAAKSAQDASNDAFREYREDVDNEYAVGNAIGMAGRTALHLSDKEAN